MKHKQLIPVFIIILILGQQITAQTKRRLSSATSTITLTQLSDTSEIEFTDKLLIWPENCKLIVKDINDRELANERDYIFINETVDNNRVSISVSERDSGTSGECRYYFAELSNTMSLNHTGMFIFKNYSNLIINLNYEGETNPIYSLFFNKLGGDDDLIFTIQNDLAVKEFKISNSYPNRLLYINRNNFLKNCLNEEPYKCSINITISSNNIPFKLLINNANDNSHATYLKANEMILGVAQAFNPLYFYREIPYGSSGEVFINYKRGGTIVYSKIVNEESKRIISEFSAKDLGDFDY